MLGSAALASEFITCFTGDDCSIVVVFLVGVITVNSVIDRSRIDIASVETFLRLFSAYGEGEVVFAHTCCRFGSERHVNAGVDSCYGSVTRSE